MRKLNGGGRVYDNAEQLNLKKAAAEFWLTSGHFCDEFETALTAYLSTDRCLLVSSGASANLLAFATLASQKLARTRIKRGDEVITTAACFPTPVSPIVQFGAIPVFVDITIPQYNVDYESLEAAVTNRTKAVFLAHTMGNPFDINKIHEFCSSHNLYLIEDCSDALGSRYLFENNSLSVGSVGEMATLSFYPAHMITTGEGGAVYTNFTELGEIAASLRDWGRDCTCGTGQDNSCGERFNGQYGTLPFGYDHKYVYSDFGYNLKMTDLQASVGVAQMKKLPGFVVIRKSNWQFLRDVLEDLSDILYLPEALEGSDPCWFGFMLTIREPTERLNRRLMQLFL